VNVVQQIVEINMANCRECNQPASKAWQPKRSTAAALAEVGPHDALAKREPRIHFNDQSVDRVAT
jgi:hypothetical protein